MLVVMGLGLVLGSGVAFAAAIAGTQNNDTLTGTLDADFIYGLNGRDIISGRAGSDEIYGGAGGDRLVGNLGNDEIYGGSGLDELFGGVGNDFINSADNDVPDSVDCGDGSDRVVADNEDTLAPMTCEDIDTVN